MRRYVAAVLSALLVLSSLVPFSPGTAPVVAAAGAPNAPTDLAATIMSANQVDLLWTDQSADETGFRIERSLDNFATAPSATFAAATDQRAFSDATVAPPTTYYYRVIAVNASGDSAPSDTAAVTVTSGLQVGPIDPNSIFQGNPNTGYPGYYQDDLGARVALLPPVAPQAFDPPDPLSPYSVFLGIGEEAFYWLAEASFDNPAGRGLAVFAIEANLVPDQPGQEVVFTRTRFRLDVPVPGDYRIQHPYGDQTFTITQDDIDARGGLFWTEDIGIAPRDFALATTGRITRLLRQANPPAGWLGDGSTGPVTGSPTGFNKIRVTGPAGVNLNGAGSNVLETDQFFVAARLQTTAPPIATFTKVLSPASGVAPVTVTFTDTTTGGAPTAWLWDFGDGTSSPLRNPVHTYSNAGTYTVRLTVTNAGGTSATSQTVSVYTTPVASFTRTLPNGVPPLSIGFTDTSAGNITGWSWDFGDGATSTLANPTHLYAEAGAYTVTLTATNPAGSASTSQTVRISPALAANFAESVSSGVAPLTVDFTDDSAGAITGWSWSFGNGAGSTAQNASATYSAAGNYPVTLTVTDAFGSAGVSRTIHVYSAPSASFTKSINAASRKTVRFTDTSAGNPVSWRWDFGDGTTSALQNPVKTYASVGAYSVTLTVTNPAGSSATSQTVFVSGLDPATPLSLQVGPLDPAFIYQGNLNTSFPGYYEDDQGTRVALLPVTGDGVTAPTQIFEPVDPASPYSVFLGAGEELFYYMAESVFNTSAGRGLIEFALEANMVPDQPGQEVVFTRTRFRLDVPVPGDYRIQHPYGDQTFTITQDDIDARGGLFFTEDIGLAPRDFLQAASGPISRFLRQASPPVGWIGDGATVGPVTGSPTGFNRVRITGPVGVNLNGAGSNVLETDQFMVSGRLQTSVAPTASFTQALDPLTGVASVAVTFTDTSTGAPTGWSWDFGDGTTSTQQNPTHTYDTAGNYTVTLTVANAVGNSAASHTVSVYTTPVAGFTRSPALGRPPLLVNFSDSSTGNITAWSWDFGDGATSALPNPSHVYRSIGTYTITLTVTNPAGSSSTSLTIRVVDRPAAPTALGATIISATQVDLAWTDNAINEDGYRVERATDGVTFSVLDTLAADAASYSDLTVALGNTYSYRVVAFNVIGDSKPSNVARVSVTTPAAPTLLRAGGVTFTQADVVWADNSDNETSFRIERSTDGVTFAAVGTAPADATAYSDTTVVEGQTYSYRVVAVNLLGESAPSNVIQALIGLPLPATNLAAALVSISQVDLTWTDNATNETGYRVERAADGVTFSVLDTLAADDAAYSDTTVALGNTYSYRVVAFNAIGDAVAPSNVVQVTVAVPLAATNLAATPVSATQVDLAWTDNATVETGYRVERSTGSADFTALTTLPPDAAGYSDATVALDNTYSYRVVAFNQGVDAPASNAANITVGVPLAPTGLSVTATGPDRVDLAWTDASNNETSFLLERSTDGATFVPVFGTASAATNATGARITFSDTGVAGATTYTYRARAGNILGDSAPSATVTVTTPNVFLTGLTTTTGLTVGPDAVAQNNATLTTINGNVTLIIPQGTRMQQRNGQPITELTAGPLGLTPPKAPPNNALVLAVDFGPDGTKFNPNITMVINYDPATLPAGVRQNKLDIALWDGANWLKLKGIVNTTARTITAQVPHFTPVGILGEQDKPLDVNAWVAGLHQVLLDWNDTFDNETGFRIERSAAGGDFTAIGTTGANEDGFIDVDAPADVLLLYRVIAINAVGDSLASDAAQTTVAPPAVPSNLAAELVGNVQVNLTWADNSNNESGFRVERATDAAFTQNLQQFVVVAGSTSFSDTTITGSATTYHYRVLAVNGAGAAPSIPAQVVAGTPAPQPQLANVPFVFADFSASVTSGAAPLTVTFTDLSTGNPAFWAWDFGDGVSTTEQNPTHVYTSEGTFTVTLRTSNEGRSDIQTKVISVGSAPATAPAEPQAPVQPQAPAEVEAKAAAEAEAKAVAEAEAKAAAEAEAKATAEKAAAEAEAKAVAEAEAKAVAEAEAKAAAEAQAKAAAEAQAKAAAEAQAKAAAEAQAKAKAQQIMVPPPQAPGAVTQVVEPARETTLVLPDQTTIRIASMALPQTAQVQARAVPPRELPNAPKGKMVKALDISLFSTQGTPMGPTSLAAPMTIEVPLSDEEMRLIGDNPSSVHVAYFDEAYAEWERLESSLDLGRKVVQGKVTHMSLFAVVISEPATSGDMWWLFAMLAGIAVVLATAGSLLYLRKQRTGAI